MARRRVGRAKSGGRSSRRRRTPRLGPWVAVLILVALGIWLIPRLRLNRGLGSGAAPRFAPEQAGALADSIDVATHRDDFQLALDYAHELVRLAPTVSGAQTKLSAAWHNYGTASRIVNGESRTACRTSLEKIDCDLRALAAADSARKLAQNDTEWLAASDVYARTLEYLGLPIDALDTYQQMLRLEPSFPRAVSRVHGITALLRDPIGNDEPL